MDIAIDGTGAVALAEAVGQRSSGDQSLDGDRAVLGHEEGGVVVDTGPVSDHLHALPLAVDGQMGTGTGPVPVA